MEFLVFMLLLIWFIRWNKRRKQRRAANFHLPQQSPVQFQNQAMTTNTGGDILQAPSPGQNFGDGWFPDPTGRYVMRYWNGQRWTEWVSSNDGRSLSDPIITKISQRGAPTTSINVAASPYRPPEPASQMEGPDLNELRRRFNG